MGLTVFVFILLFVCLLTLYVKLPSVLETTVGDEALHPSARQKLATVGGCGSECQHAYSHVAIGGRLRSIHGKPLIKISSTIHERCMM